MAFFHRRKMEWLGFPGRVPASFLSLLFRLLTCATAWCNSSRFWIRWLFKQQRMVGGFLLIRLRRILTHVLFRLRQAAPACRGRFPLGFLMWHGPYTSAIARDRVFLLFAIYWKVPLVRFLNRVFSLLGMKWTSWSRQKYLEREAFAKVVL